MTYDEALNGIVDGLSNLENYDEHLSVLRAAADTMARAETTEDWESKYNALADKYRARFRERADGDYEAKRALPIEEKKPLTFDDIDFDGRTE